MKLTDSEPQPRTSPNYWHEKELKGKSTQLNRDIQAPERSFESVLYSRKSGAGSKLTSSELSSLLWHTQCLRERRLDGRFPVPWESRNYPSAGGLHPIMLLVLAEEFPPSVYKPDQHKLVILAEAEPTALQRNNSSVESMLGNSAGTTIQLVADISKVDAHYDNCETLIWRDAGVLVMTICLVSEWLGLAVTPLGRTGSSIVKSCGLTEPYDGVGAVQVGSAKPDAA